MAEHEKVKKKQQLTSEHSIITDAAVRRFQCQRAYLRANAGLRWMNSRNSILRGQKPNANHLGALQQADATLRNVGQTVALISSSYKKRVPWRSLHENRD
jgi:hypothetical protein